MIDAALLERKNVLRALMRRRLAASSVDERIAQDRRIIRRIVELPAWRRASHVLLFAPLPLEPNLDLLWLDEALVGKRVAYPRMDGEMIRLYHVESLKELEPTRWGLREPPRAGREAALDDFGIVLVPGLAFDGAGGRLGRGGGFYDRLLSERPVDLRLVGVGYDFQRVVEGVPMAEHDVRMDDVCMGDVLPLDGFRPPLE